MSSFAGYCSICGKHVMHKTLFGTLHLCLSAEERLYLSMQQQMNALNKAPNSGLQALLRKHPELAQPYGRKPPAKEEK